MLIDKKNDLGRIGFGKFKGQKWSEIPENYVEFLASKESYISEDQKIIANKELKNRSILDNQLRLF